MNCEPELVTAYVDGALDPGRRAELEAHLSECEACRAQAEAENDLCRGLRSLPEIALPEGLEQSVRRRLAPRRSTRLRVLLPLAASLVVAVLWGRGSASFVAWELARDHAHCFGLSRLPAEVWSDDTSVITSWFEARGQTLPDVPRRAGSLELVGARRCPLLDRVVAHLYYESADRHVSIFVVPGSVRFDTPYAAQSRGLGVRLLRIGGSVVGLVAEEDEDLDAFENALRTSVASNESDASTPVVDRGRAGLLR